MDPVPRLITVDVATAGGKNDQQFTFKGNTLKTTIKIGKEEYEVKYKSNSLLNKSDAEIKAIAVAKFAELNEIAKIYAELDEAMEGTEDNNTKLKANLSNHTFTYKNADKEKLSNEKVVKELNDTNQTTPNPKIIQTMKNITEWAKKKSSLPSVSAPATASSPALPPSAVSPSALPPSAVSPSALPPSAVLAPGSLIVSAAPAKTSDPASSLTLSPVPAEPLTTTASYLPPIFSFPPSTNPSSSPLTTLPLASLSNPSTPLPPVTLLPPSSSPSPSATIATSTIPTAAPTNITPGVALGANFKWPSDHLPIGGECEIKNKDNKAYTINFGSYNILNQTYNTEKNINNLGLKNSGIDASSTQTSINYPDLSKREEMIVNQILDMFKKGRDILGLQECSRNVFNVLNEKLPPNIKIFIPDTLKNNEDMQPIIYNSDKLQLDNNNVELSSYTLKLVQNKAKYHDSKKIIDVTFSIKEDGNVTNQKVRFINTHVARPEGSLEMTSLKTHIRAHKPKEGVPIILVGDMNTHSGTKLTKNTDQKTYQGIQDNFNSLESPDFSFKHTLISGSNPTAVNTGKQSVDYDQMWLITNENDKNNYKTKNHSPTEIFNSKEYSDGLDQHKKIFDNYYPKTAS